MIKALKTFDIDPKHWPAMAANRTNWRHRYRINKWYLSPEACQYLVSTRINRIETVFPCPSFLLFVLCLLSRSSWNLCSNRSWSNYYYYYYFQIFKSNGKSLSRWHSFGSISNASTTWGRSSADGIHTITISANEAKTQEEELMQQWTNNENEPRRAA